MKFKLSFVVLILYYVASPSMGQGSPSGSDGSPVPQEGVDGKPKVDLKDQPPSLMTRSEPSVWPASRLNQLEAEFRGKIEEIKTQTGRSSKDQNEKIAIITVRERNLAQLLNQTRKEMVRLKTQNKDQTKRIDQLEQKLATLQNTPPASLALTRGNNKEKMKNGASNNNGQVSKASTPPSSCEELAMLDHYLDGLYLVKNKQTKKVQTVFCQFSADDKSKQALIGTIDIKTKIVHFYVQRNSSFSRPDAVIPFDLARINEGDAFNLASGFFTIPVPGIYHFDFSSAKSIIASYLCIHLQVNGTSVGRAYTSQLATGEYHTVSLSASLRLTAGDRVNLFSVGSGVTIDNGDRTTHFSGWLVEEDLI